MNARAARRAFVLLIATASVLLPAGIARAGGGCHNESTTQGSGRGIVYDQMCAVPNVLNVRVGETVVWTNKDDMQHTVTSGSGWWANDTLESGGTFSHRFDTAGVYPFYCQLHPNMGGVVLVGQGKPAAAGSGKTPVATEASSSSGGWLALASGLGIVIGGAAVSVRRRLLGSATQKEGGA